MNLLKSFGFGFFFLLAAGYSPWRDVHAIAVEYELDGPLDLKQKWSFVRDANFFLQHQCGEQSGKAAALRIKGLTESSAEQLKTGDAPKLLQVRLLPGFDAYRRAFRFSKERHAHHDELMDIVASYCNVASPILQEQIILHLLSETPLRLWQKVFIAEILPSLEKKGRINSFAESAKVRPQPLTYVLLSNHRPEKAERATLRRLALFLQKRDKLWEFIRRLTEERRFDDTGMEILESMFPEGLKAVEAQINPPSNNTLPARR